MPGQTSHVCPDCDDFWKERRPVTKSTDIYVSIDGLPEKIIGTDGFDIRRGVAKWLGKPASTLNIFLVDTGEPLELTHIYTADVQSPLALKIIPEMLVLSAEAQAVKDASQWRLSTDSDGINGLVVPLRVAQKYPDVWTRYYYGIPRGSNYKIELDYTIEGDDPRGHIIEVHKMFHQSQSTMSTHLNLRCVGNNAAIVIDPNWLRDCSLEQSN